MTFLKSVSQKVDNPKVELSAVTRAITYCHNITYAYYCYAPKEECIHLKDFSRRFYKGDKFFDFKFTFLYTEPSRNRVYS